MNNNNIIKKLRQENGFTQKELAYILGVSRSCLSSWELETRNIPFYKINELCHVFGVDPSEFLTKDIGYSAPNLLFDMSTLNAEGVAKMQNLYEKLIKDEKYLKTP